MDVSTLILSVLLVFVHSQPGSLAAFRLDEKLATQKRLKIINKPAVKSFVTKYADIVDCVEINKQLAFDHPLLKNHSIQMRPSFDLTRRSNTSDQGLFPTVKPSQVVLPKNMRCPLGTVPRKRIQEQDLAVMEKFSSLFASKFSNIEPSNFGHSNDNSQGGHHVAVLVTSTKNTGVSGNINVWHLEVTSDQYSDASMFVSSGDGSVTNGIQAGWAVIPYLFQNNFTRMYTYWSKDSGRTTGCFNDVCPGFVQVSTTTPLGLILGPVSTYGGAQYASQVAIKQDQETKNWWLMWQGENIGYWPKEIFSTLANGATQAGWGGEVYSPVSTPAPAMGSGHFADEGFAKASFIFELGLNGVDQFPSTKDLKYLMSRHECYNVMYKGDGGGKVGHYMYFGGPPNC